MFAVNDLCQSAPILAPLSVFKNAPLVRSCRSITAIARLEMFFAFLGLECLDLKLVGRFLVPIVMAHTARLMLVDPPGREHRKRYKG